MAWRDVEVLEMHAGSGEPSAVVVKVDCDGYNLDSYVLVSFALWSLQL